MDHLPEEMNLARESPAGLPLPLPQLPRTLSGGQLVAFFSVVLGVGLHLQQSKMSHSKTLGLPSFHQSLQEPLRRLPRDQPLPLDAWHVSTMKTPLLLLRQHPKLVIVREACGGDAAWDPSALGVVVVADRSKQRASAPLPPVASCTPCLQRKRMPVQHPWWQVV